MSETRTLESQDELFTADLAGKHKQSVVIGHPPSSDLLKAYDRDGYVILKGLLSDAVRETAETALRDLLGPTGRNDFEGFNTQRAYALLAKTRALDLLIAHPQILGILKARLHAQPLLSASLAINIGPGETPQLPHADDGFYPDMRPDARYGLSVIWAFDPFTAANGATRTWPGSHHWPAEGRLALTAQYCAPWLRTQETMSLSVPPDIVRTLRAPLPSLLGYQIHPPFMGHVNGMHPNRLLED